MDRIIPDDILEDQFTVITSVTSKEDKLSYSLMAVFFSVDNRTYDVCIEHKEDTSEMVLKEGSISCKYYFSPYITQRFFRALIPAYGTSKSKIKHKTELISLINKILYMTQR